MTDRLPTPPRRRGSPASTLPLLALAILVGLGAFPRRLPAATPVLSEFMADNRSTLADEDGEFSDWIEVANPGPEPLPLAGFFLTDDPERPTRWAFPALTLAPGEHRIVFASGKNRRLPSAPLHTSFQLDADGEYLALVGPDGRTVVDAFAPAYPRQSADVAYGRPPEQTTRDLLAAGDLAYKVPGVGTALEPAWIEAEFPPDPGAGWLPGAGFGLGFDTGFGFGVGTNRNLARGGTATQSTTAAGFSPGLALDGNLATFTHTTSSDNRSSWTADLGRETEIVRVVLHNRGDCCQARLRDITVSLVGPDGTTLRWRSALLNPENTLDSPARLEVDLFDLEVGPVAARFVRVDRTPDPDLSGSGGLGNADEDNVLTLAEVEVEGVETVTFAPLIRTDVGSAMRGRSSAVAVRCAFVPVPDLSPEGPLQFRVRFDDGFVAWFNGQPVARANAPETLAGSIRATAENPDPEALKFATFEIPASALRPGTNVLAVLGLNLAPDDDDFLLDARLEVSGRYRPPPAYFDQPTPGAANSGSWHLGRLSPPAFSAERGFHDQPFDLRLEPVGDPAVTLVYTLDGSEPTATHGTLYREPIPVRRTTLVRARAIRPDYRGSEVASHTYLFPADTLNQPANPAGFPARWAEVAADYEMDPAITRNPAWAGRLADSLRALPSISLATGVDGLFGASLGIYANPENRGPSWERPVSMEWIEAGAPSRSFQADAGLRIQGGYFRQRGVTQKHSLRLVFKDEYGPGRLRGDLFEQFGAVREFDTLVLRAGANDGYAWNAARDTEQFLRDEFGRRLALAMGQPAPHGRFVHVYLNGLYWGLYNLCERPNEDFSASYHGGEPADWDAVNSGEIKSGDLAAWNAYLAALATTRTAADVLALQGLRPDGRPDPALPVYLDVDHYADYMLLNIWGGNWDWPNKNFWFGRRRTADRTGFRFYLWDFENTMGNNRDRSPLGMVSPRAGITAEWVAAPHARLKSIPEYQLRFGDRVHRHLLGDGPLAPAALVARYRALADALEPAVLAETARWGDDHWEPPQDLSDWQRERDWLLGDYLPRRTEVVLGQLRAAGLYPALPAPAVVTPSLPLTAASPILLRTPARALYYTLDGTDPRLPGGAPNPAAFHAEFATEAGDSPSTWNTAAPLFLTRPTRILARSWNGTAWSALTHARIVPDARPAESASLLISEIAYRPPDAITPAELAVTRDRDAFEFVELLNIGNQPLDLADVRLAGGVEFDFALAPDSLGVLAPGARVLLVASRAAFEARYGPGLPVAGEFRGHLGNEGDSLRLETRNGTVLHRLAWTPTAPWPSTTDAPDRSLVLIHPESRPNLADPAHWRASTQPGGNPGTNDTVPFAGPPEADLDSNGQADLVDYAVGNPDGGLRITLVKPEASAGFLRLEHARKPAADAARILIETAGSALGPWNVAGLPTLEFLGTTPGPDGRERVSYRTPLPGSGESSRYFRLVVVR